jgi:hypothetical protein
MQKAIEPGANSGDVAEQFAITCCFLSSLNTLLTLMQGNSRYQDQCPGSALPLAAFQMTTIGPLWLIQTRTKA